MSSAAPSVPPPCPAPEAEETGWMRRIAAGEEAAMQRMFERWKLPLLSFFHRLLGARLEAEDLTLEVFVRLHRAAPGYAPTAKFSTYLFAIAQRLALNELRRRRRKPAEPVPPGTFDHLPAHGRAEARGDELEEVFQQALATLAPKQRSALLLIAQQQLSYEEAARVLRTTPNALRVLVHRARQDLKTRMEEWP